MRATSHTHEQELEVTFWIEKLGFKRTDARAYWRVRHVLRIAGQGGLERAYAMLRDKQQATGEDATPLRDPTRYTMWCLLQVLPDGE